RAARTCRGKAGQFPPDDYWRPIPTSGVRIPRFVRSRTLTPPHPPGHGVCRFYHGQSRLNITHRGPRRPRHPGDGSLARPLGPVLGTALAAILHTSGVKGAADDLVTDTRKILDAAAMDEHHRVLLQVVALAGDVRRHLDAVDQAYTRDLPKGGVGLLGRHGPHLEADAPLLGVLLQRRRLLVLGQRAPSLTDQLVDRRHSPHLLPSGSR